MLPKSCPAHCTRSQYLSGFATTTLREAVGVLGGPVGCTHFDAAAAQARSVVLNGRWLSLLCDSVLDSEEAVTWTRVVIFETLSR